MSSESPSILLFLPGLGPLIIGGSRHMQWGSASLGFIIILSLSLVKERDFNSDGELLHFFLFSKENIHESISFL